MSEGETKRPDAQPPAPEDVGPPDQSPGIPVPDDAQDDEQQLAEARLENQQLDEMTTQLEEAQQRALRAQAELENFRKRSRRELEDERRYAALPMIRDLLGILDNLQRAITAAEQHQNQAGLLEGVKMVASQFQTVLDQHHCRPIAALGELFDPNVHEAIAQQPTSEHPPGTVTQETRVGYQLHDRVVRPSQVLVAVQPPPTENDSAAATET